MTSDAERRKIAQKLREDMELCVSGGHYCFDSEVIRYLCGVLGFRCSECCKSWKCLEALADLIDPKCYCPHYTYQCCKTDTSGNYIDRDALLRVADETKTTMKEAEPMGFIFPWRLGDYAHRVREALGA